MNPDPFAPESPKRPAFAIALQLFNAVLFGALALGAALIKAGVYLVALLAIVALAYALDLARLLREAPRRD